MRQLLLIIWLSAVGSGYCQAQENVEKGEEAFEVCAACHGESGEGSEDFGAPRLAGQHGWYLKTQLINFKAGIRGTHEDDENGQVMQPMAEDLEEQTMDDLIAYIVTLPIQSGADK